MSQREPKNNDGNIGVLLFVLLVWVVIFWLSYLSYRPVEPRPESIAADQFSAARADKFLKELVGDSIPHPAGSAQNEVVRNKIVAMLESFGYTVQVQSGNGQVAIKVKDRSPNRSRVDLHNIIAIRRAKSDGAFPPKKPIMLVSHYDSVPFGPGASDDGVATAAVLEIARMFSTEAAPDRDIIFLITDGEEFGLLGSKLFVNENPLAKEVGVAINLEARGSTGPSCLFETGRMSRKLIPIFAKATDKKIASSLFIEVYKRMPRDTDFSVFKRAGILGYNFAFLGNVKNYHTTADNYENVDQGSLQHHGDNALGLLRNLLDSDDLDLLFETGSDHDEAVYFDLFGKWIIWWPSGWSVWLTVLALVMFASSAGRILSTRSEGISENESTNFLTGVAKHLGIQIVTLLAVFGVGYLIQMAVRLDPRLSHPWPSNPIPMVIGYWLAGFSVVGAIAIAFSKRTRASFYLISFCVIWLTLAFLTSISVAGASHLFLVPVLITSAFGLATCCFGQRGLQATLIAAAIMVGVIWIPLERILYDAVGFRMPIIMMARIAIISTTMLGLLSMTNDRTKFWFTMLCSVLSIAAFVTAIALAG